jgi:ATP-dependent RNA helicase RhlE
LIQQMLVQRKLVTPTPIQHQAIAAVHRGDDVVGIAQTGTGKTFAFGLPTLDRLKEQGGHALIVLPTRELALQVDESLAPFAKVLGLRMAVLIGGMSMRPQMTAIRQRPNVVICTPGRLLDHLRQRTITLSGVKTLILDEADRMLDMGFMPQIREILKAVPKDRQTLLFSATMPPEILQLIRGDLRTPTHIEVARAGTTATNVQQEVCIVTREQKLDLLKEILTEEPGTVLVFCRTKHGAKKVTQKIMEMGHRAAEIHGNRSLAQRTSALSGFKTGSHRVLVATDIAARGIDVTGIALVVNFDLPDDAADYVHRIGRTGRAGLSGKAISLATPDQLSLVARIERLTRKPLQRRGKPALPEGQPQERKPQSPLRGSISQRPRFGRKGGGRRR